MHFGAGLAVGFSGLAAGFAIGIVGDAGVRGTAQQPRLFVGMILILIFAEVQLQLSSFLPLKYSKVKYTAIAKFAGHLPHRYGNSRAIWDHTVLPATRQR